jgi:CRISPR-associated protein Cst1
MKEEQTVDWLTHQTGDPFTDIGGYVWAFLKRKYPNKKPVEIIQIVAKTYIIDWEQKMHPFFANSKITHNSYGGKQGKSLSDTISFYQQVMDESNLIATSKIGFCRITGRKTVLFSAERSTTILNGAGSLMNFHHAFEEGSMVSKEVLIRNFVMPLGVIQVGSLPSIIISNDEHITKYIAENNCQAHFDALGQNINKGLRKARANNVANALFQYVIQIHRDIDYQFDIEHPESTGIALNMYSFSNFVNGPALNLNTLSANAFSFYTFCLKRHEKDWLNFVNAHYRIPDTRTKGKTEEEIPESHSNPILNTIMKGGNLSFNFLTWIRDTKNINFQIVELYQILIRNMDKKTIQVLRRIADFIAQKCTDDETSKTIRKLNSANSRRDVFTSLLKLVEKNKGNAEPLIRLDDVDFLFPEGFSWVETRNILLIAIYEQLHEANRKVENTGELADEQTIADLN